MGGYSRNLVFQVSSKNPGPRTRLFENHLPTCNLSSSIFFFRHKNIEFIIMIIILNVSGRNSRPSDLVPAVFTL